MGVMALQSSLHSPCCRPRAANGDGALGGRMLLSGTYKVWDIRDPELLIGPY